MPDQDPLTLIPTVSDADIDMEELQLDHEYRVLVVTASKLKAKIYSRLVESKRRTIVLEKRMHDIDGLLTRGNRG